MLHLAMCERIGQALPPCCILDVMVRWRTFVPPPHETLHAFQPEKAVTAQSMAHGCSLHD